MSAKQSYSISSVDYRHKVEKTQWVFDLFF